MRATIICSLCLFTMASTPARATIHVIDANHPGGIQEVITNVAQNGDVIELLPGTYTGPGNTGINYLGLLITIRSQSGAATCIIDCQNSSRGVVFSSGETAAARLEGVTIRHANEAVYCAMSDPETSPTISQCVFEDGGYGVLIDMYTSATINDCVFSRNNIGVVTAGGAVISNSIFCANEDGVSGYQSGVTITESLICGNTTGIDATFGSVQLSSCTVTGNRTGVSGWRVGIGFQHSILWGNCMEAELYGQTSHIGFSCSDVNSAGVSCDNPPVYDAQTIFVDPVFCEPQDCNSAPNCSGDYGLSSNSPCLAAASPCGVLMGARDENCTVIAVEPKTWGAVKSLFR